MAARKDKPVECYVLRGNRSIPAMIADDLPYPESSKLKYERATLTLYDLLDGLTVEEAIAALAKVKEEHGNVTFEIRSGEYEGDGDRVFMSIKRPMDADEHLRYDEMKLARMRRTEENERRQYEALKARFEGGKK